MRPGEEGAGTVKEKRSRPPARHLRLVLKLALGTVILAVIASKLTLVDRVQLRDGHEIRGRHLSFDPRHCALEYLTEQGSPARIPLEEAPDLLQRGEQWRLRTREGTLLPIRQPSFSGMVSLEVDGSPRQVPLGEVGFVSHPDAEGWQHHTLAVREGLLTIYGRLSASIYVLAMVLLLVSYLLGIWRWQILLRAQGLLVPYRETTRLTFIGFFFNNVVPGLTGGDVVKAVMIAQGNRGRGPDAVSTVIVDRVLGLLVLAAISAAFLAFTFTRYREVAIWLFAILFGSVLLIAIFLSRRLRRRFRLDQLLKRLPGSESLRRLDQAFLLYRSRGKEVLQAVGLSLLVHAGNIFSIYLMGTDLGLDAGAGLQGQPFVTYVATVPTILIASSLPLLPGGWGLGEAAYAYFFRTVGVRNLSLSVGLSVLTRASTLLWSLAGGVFFLMGRREAREALKEASGTGAAMPGGSLG